VNGSWGAECEGRFTTSAPCPLAHPFGAAIFRFHLTAHLIVINICISIAFALVAQRNRVFVASSQIFATPPCHAPIITYGGTLIKHLTVHKYFNNYFGARKTISQRLIVGA